ncbi:MAG: glycoside hydrolase family 16 protein [Saprospirales bacterium]|nr:glycoside hydrolase family 16 protein [Saprospirales bacterium]
MKWNNSILTISLLLLILPFTFWSCLDNNAIEEHNWQLVWSDEFEGTAGQLPNPANWTYDLGIGPGNDGWGNAELQFYTDRRENASLDGQGNLAITARSESYSGRSFTSARIKTQGLFDQAYGRFEARIKMPTGPGLWPAFWMLGSNIDVVDWPQCGEIDIVEYRGNKPTVVDGSLHGPGYSKEKSITKNYGFENARFDTDFHVFAVEWTEGYINYFVDDVVYQRITPDDVSGEWVFDHPFHLLMNLAVGGNFVGFPTSQTLFPQAMLVDYVRVYKEVN